MPLYQDQCDDCGRRFERIQKYSDPLVEVCPHCGGKVHKLISSPAFHLKGTGWYATDYRKGESPASAEAAEKSGDKGEKPASSGGEGSSDSKAKESSKESGKESSKESSKESNKDSGPAKPANKDGPAPSATTGPSGSSTSSKS